jgi:hypothetical protein
MKIHYLSSFGEDPGMNRFHAIPGTFTMWYYRMACACTVAVLTMQPENQIRGR